MRIEFAILYTYILILFMLNTEKSSLKTFPFLVGHAVVFSPNIQEVAWIIKTAMKLIEKNISSKTGLIKLLVSVFSFSFIHHDDL